jgi:hypothetical protein
MTVTGSAKPGRQAKAAKEETAAAQTADSTQGNAQDNTPQSSAHGSEWGDLQGASWDSPELTALEFFRQAVADELAARGVFIRKDGEKVAPVSADLASILIQPDSVTVVTTDGLKIELDEVPQ